MDRPNLKEQLKGYFKLYDFPTDVLVETISVCNLACVMCPYPKLTRASGAMSMDLWKKIIDEVVEKSPGTRIWPALMGEPLLDKMIFSRIKYAKQKGVQQVCLNSNLNKFNTGMADELFDSRVDALIVGIDGFNPETYARIRVKGTFDVVVENLQYILSERERRGLAHPQVTVQFICMDENEHEEEAFIDYWKNSGLDIQIKIRPRLDWSNGVEAWSRIREIGQDQRVPCTWLLRQMVVYWDGQVPQCDADWNGATHYANINDTTIESVWQGKIRELQQKHLNYEFTASPLCPTCDEWKSGLSQYIQVQAGQRSAI